MEVYFIELIHTDFLNMKGAPIEPNSCTNLSEGMQRTIVVVAEVQGGKNGL